ncbi:unnamed protein product [Urochloa humidicola]
MQCTPPVRRNASASSRRRGSTALGQQRSVTADSVMYIRRDVFPLLVHTVSVLCMVTFALYCSVSMLSDIWDHRRF